MTWNPRGYGVSELRSLRDAGRIDGNGRTRLPVPLWRAPRRRRSSWRRLRLLGLVLVALGLGLILSTVGAILLRW